MKRLNGTKELTNYQRKKMEKKIAKQQANELPISQEQREEIFSELKNEKMKNERINQPPKHRYYPKDLDNFIRDNERRKQNAQNRTPKPPAIHHLKVNLSFWQRLRVLFGATPSLVVSFDRNKNHAENIGTVFNNA